MKNELNYKIIPNSLTFGGPKAGDFVHIDGDNLGGSIITAYTKKTNSPGEGPAVYINALQIGNHKYGGNGGVVTDQGQIPNDGSIFIQEIHSYNGILFHIKLSLGEYLFEAGDNNFADTYAGFRVDTKHGGLGLKAKFIGLQYYGGDDGRISQLVFQLTL